MGVYKLYQLWVVPYTGVSAQFFHHGVKVLFSLVVAPYVLGGCIQSLRVTMSIIMRMGDLVLSKLSG